MTSASHPRPLPSVVRDRLKNHGKRRQVPPSVTIVGRICMCDVAAAHGDDELRMNDGQSTVSTLSPETTIAHIMGRDRGHWAVYHVCNDR